MKKKKKEKNTLHVREKKERRRERERERERDEAIMLFIGHYCLGLGKKRKTGGKKTGKEDR